MRNNNNNNSNKNSNDSEQQQEVALISVFLPLRCALIKCQRVAGAGQRAEGASGAGFAVVAATQRGSAGFHFSSVCCDQGLSLVI